MAIDWIKLGMIAAGTAAIWLFVLARWGQGRAVIAYRPRRPALRDGGHLFLMVVIYLVMFGVAAAAIHHFLPDKIATPNPSEDTGTAHIIVKMVKALHGNPWIFLVAAMAAVAVAPIVEEFFFRVLLQGWLETLQRQNRRWPGHSGVRCRGRCRSC